MKFDKKYLILVPITFVATLIIGLIKVFEMAKKTYSHFGHECNKCEMWLRYFLRMPPYDRG